jgi:hypothetical protein
MKHRNNLFARVLRGMLKLLFGLAIVVFLFTLLLAVLVMMLGVTLGSLLTGRKPAPLAAFSQFRQTSQRYTQGVWPGRAAPGADSQAAGDVVDVQAHEIPDAPETSTIKYKPLSNQ